MANVLVKTKEQFAQFANLRSKGEGGDSTRFFIEENLFVEFSDFAVTHARKTGFLYGVICALGFVVGLVGVAKTVAWW